MTLVPEILPGHFDGNGFVDGVAILKWQRGESPNRMSTLDQADWGVNYGAAASLSANSSEVPEPSAANSRFRCRTAKTLEEKLQALDKLFEEMMAEAEAADAAEASQSTWDGDARLPSCQVPWPI